MGGEACYTQGNIDIIEAINNIGTAAISLSTRILLSKITFAYSDLGTKWFANNNLN